MTCRHAKGDPACSSTVGGYAWQEQQEAYRRSAEESRSAVEKERDKALAEVRRLTAALQKYASATGTTEPPETPDSHNYEIIGYQQVGTALVLKIQYPNCAKCSYEGIKICVYENTSVGDALLWRVIDPHFQDSKKPRSKREAPGPSARFPGSETGWADAIAYAHDVLGHRASAQPQPQAVKARCPYESNSHGTYRCVLERGHAGEHRFDSRTP